MPGSTAVPPTQHLRLKNMTIRNSHAALLLYRLSEKWLIPILQRHLPNPNQLSLLGLILAMAVPVGFTLHPLGGFVFLCLSGLADVLDGQLARKLDRQSRFGAFWDSSLDRLADFFYLMGFWILFFGHVGQTAATVLIFLSLFFTLMISYVKARAEALGGVCDQGLMDRAIRTLYLIVWALLLGLMPGAYGKILWAGLGLFCLLTLLTVIQRMALVRTSLKDGH
jgi:CDP-diacylglycerol---glycerol-3-phosphate 3-phosphatidyltransferase